MAYETYEQQPVTAEQLGLIDQLCAQLKLEKPANAARLTKAEASATITQMIDLRKQRAAAKKGAPQQPAATQQPAPAPASQQEAKPNRWRERNYDPVKAGLASKLAVQEMVAGTKRPSIHSEVFIATSIEIYGSLLELELQLWKRHKDAQAELAQ